MDAARLKELQEPIKRSYRESPASAQVVLSVRGIVDQQRLACSVQTHLGLLDAGLHPAAGGDGSQACSGEMLLEALVACAGVTLSAVATAMGIELRSAAIEASGTMDFRGTLGVDRSVPVGITAIQMQFSLDSDASIDQLTKLVQLTERYCVIFQTLKNAVQVESRLAN